MLKMLSAGACGIALPQVVLAKFGRLAKPVKLGVITDLHQDVMHDAPQRLDAFLATMKRLKPDALMQMGDFAVPKKENQKVVDSFNQAHDTVMHVIGNHDTDGGYKKEQVLKAWGMEKRYYSKDVGGLRFLVLDGNDKGSPTHKGGYASYVGPEQVQWLEKELEAYDGPVVVASHQPLAGHYAVNNAKQIQQILSKHKDKVVISINGHSHIDCLLEIEGVHYLHINSASYYWVGGKYKHESYSKEVHAKHKYIAATCPYKESVFTMLEFDPVAGVVKVQGRMSEWVGKSPQQLNVPKIAEKEKEAVIVPGIRERTI
ncbi:3',5'-cyclic adenosine monophosphate phosphodiesterase CpdA [Rubritalea halochordaticola]|uniref:3',5'-cyclic adenosine monophosphate phosphodiesterase CpdA n=2 Tax=Rubritalea halochordaticola TaxID=714537 RepID=A0ABP9V4S0_9BACT